ncbi:hypothetical protein [Streptomyces sp. P17]|uniref:VpaChn25_0724 family phage protein n=1 Tax=Streptomyces sp. P17 TaxID=3074716 RepID=UPI0028F4002F|nr:hypothetical protein [Streptomyces sp. P17]MDT9702016.1 hypothetical protein [Streptomyces sp. P17]
MIDYAKIMREDARLIILKGLSEQTNESLHSGYLDLLLRRFAIEKDREWIHDELRWLAERGAVTLIEAGTVLVATLTTKGARHLKREIAIEGVSRPSRKDD